MISVVGKTAQGVPDEHSVIRSTKSFSERKKVRAEPQ
jgi:hypothetical protein